MKQISAIILVTALILASACSSDNKSKPETGSLADSATSQKPLSDSAVKSMFNSYDIQDLSLKAPKEVQDILKNCLKARFGENMMTDFSTIDIELTAHRGNMGTDVHARFKLPDKMLVESKIGDMKGYVLFSGGVCKTIQPGTNEVIIVTGDTAKLLQADAIGQTEYELCPLISIMKNGYVPALVGKEADKGREYYVVKFVNPRAVQTHAKDYDEHLVYIDTKSFLDDRYVSEIHFKGQKTINISYVKDNRKVGKYVIAHKIQGGAQGLSFELKSVKINQPIDDQVFKLESTKK